VKTITWNPSACPFCGHGKVKAEKPYSDSMTESLRRHQCYKCKKRWQVWYRLPKNQSKYPKCPKCKNWTGGPTEGEVDYIRITDDFTIMSKLTCDCGHKWERAHIATDISDDNVMAPLKGAKTVPSTDETKRVKFVEYGLTWRPKNCIKCMSNNIYEEGLVVSKDNRQISCKFGCHDCGEKYRVVFVPYSVDYLKRCEDFRCDKTNCELTSKPQVAIANPNCTDCRYNHVRRKTKCPDCGRTGEVWYDLKYIK